MDYLIDTKKSRQIDICSQDIRVLITDELFIETDADGADYVNATYEMWFDVDKYFGTNTKSDDAVWVNFYTNWYADGKVTAQMFLNTPTQDIQFEWPLTAKEKKFFAEKMEEAAQKQTGMSLKDLLASVA